MLELWSYSALAADREAAAANGLGTPRTAANEKRAISPTRPVKRDIARTPESADSKTFRDRVKPLLTKYCIECHGRETHEGEVNFEAFKDFSAAVGQRKTWEACAKDARQRFDASGRP